MKMQVNDLTGAALDYAVAVADGRDEIKGFAPSRPRDRGFIEVRFNPDRRAATARFDPSVNWEQGGPIIERERLYLQPGPVWYAMRSDVNQPMITRQSGPTPLIAAMRCYVASKLGDMVEVPDCLVSKE